MDKEKQGNRLIDLYILFSKLSIDKSYFCVTWIWNVNFLLALIFHRWKYKKLNFAIENINFAAGFTSNIHYYDKNYTVFKVIMQM